MQDKRNTESAVQEIMGLVREYGLEMSWDMDSEDTLIKIESKLRELVENKFSVRELEAAQAQRVPLSVENLEDWKRRVNTVAACSLKADRYRVGAALKQDIADAIYGITQEKQG